MPGLPAAAFDVLQHDLVVMPDRGAGGRVVACGHAVKAGVDLPRLRAEATAAHEDILSRAGLSEPDVTVP